MKHSSSGIAGVSFRVYLRIAVTVILLLSTTSVFGLRHVVTTGIDSVPQSLRSAVAAATVPDTIRDTIVFEVKETDTVVLKDQILIDYPFVRIEGRNLHSGNRMVIQVENPGKSPYRVFDIMQGGIPPMLENLKLRGGDLTHNQYDLVGGVLRCFGGVIMDSIEVSDGVALHGGGIAFEGRLTMKNSSIVNNTAFCSRPTESAYGGGLFSYDGSLVLMNCTVAGNRCSTFVQRDGSHSAQGGGVYTYEGHLWIFNCTIAENRAVSAGYFQTHGGGIYSYEGIVEIVSSTVVKNACTCEYDSPDSPTVHNHAKGGGVWSYENSCFILNSIVLGNTAGNNSWEIPSDHWCQKAEIPISRHSLIGASNLPLYSLCPDCPSEPTLPGVFGTGSPVLTLKAPLQKSYCLGPSSVAKGEGVRVAIHLRHHDENSRPATLPDAAYLVDGRWISLETGAEVPADSVTTLLQDQSGADRPEPPAIGATECIVQNGPVIKKPGAFMPEVTIAVTGSAVYLDCGSTVKGTIRLLDLCGRTVYHYRGELVAGRNIVRLPRMPNGCHFLYASLDENHFIRKKLFSWGSSATAPNTISIGRPGK